MDKFRLLKADEIECRISQISDNGLSILLYKTARTDANMLDEVVGPDNWENDFKVVDGVLYGGIGIFFDNGKEIWKWDAGTESNMEAEKGRASDAFKRAGFKWGIGRELYTAPFIWIASDKCEIKTGKNGKLICNDKFEVTEIDYNEKREIVKLAISNKNRRKNVFNLGEYKYTTPDAQTQYSANKDSKTPFAFAAPDGEYYCETCSKIITPFISSGTILTPKDFAENTIARYGKQLCKACAMKAKDESKAS